MDSKTNNEGAAKMNYNEACELLGFTTPKSLSENAKMAASRLNRLSDTAPLRYHVACQVIINAAK